MTLRTIAHGRTRLEVPEQPFRLDAIAPPARPRTVLDGAAIARALAEGLDADGLHDVWRGARRVLIAVSDATRKTAADRLLPALLDLVESRTRAEVGFAVGGGIHRAPRPEEIERILGPEAIARGRVHVHDADDASRLIHLGRTSAGTPVKVSALLREYDRIVLTGAVGFHYYAGFSGGRKAIVPGLASRETVTRNHLRALRRDGTRHPLARAGRLDGNPVHRDMVEGAGLVGPHMTVNTVLDDDGAVERVYAGHWRRAHERACRYVRDTRSVRVEPRPLVVASAGGHPSDLNLIQAHKAFEAGFGALRPGGVFVLAAECPEGAGHDDFLPWLRFQDDAAFATALRANFQVYGQTALAWFRKARACRLILVSSLDPSVAAVLGATPARDLSEALGIARENLPAGAPGWLLPAGSRLLVEPGPAAAVAAAS